MSHYLYEAVDAAGLRSKGSLEVLEKSSAVIAMFLPLITLIEVATHDGNGGQGSE